VSNATDISGLFVFVMCLVCLILSMSLDGLSSSCVLCFQFCQCLWIVCLRPLSCVSDAANVSGLFVFVLCLVCPMLPMFLDFCLRPVSCVSNAADVSGLFVFVLCLVCPKRPMSLDCLSSSCVLCVQYCRCLWIVCLRPVSCVSNTADVSRLFVFVLCLVCPILPMSLDCLSSSCFLGRRKTFQRHRQHCTRKTQD
jgi:cbb3-type cytochrome oxidase subunit 3